MRVLIQKVSQASVTIENICVSEIGKGLLALVGIEDADGDEDIEWLANKIVLMRLFHDENGVMNKSVVDVSGDILLVSQFTLHASIKKGNRPSYIRAARREKAIPIYQKMIEALETKLGKKVPTGRFGADMQVALVNDGPVTIWLDSKNKE